MEIDRINGVASARGWRLERRGFDDATNPLGMADLAIVAVGAVFADDDQATINVVEAAWSEDELSMEALARMRAEAPEAYVRAIYLAHGTPQA